MHISACIAYMCIEVHAYAYVEVCVHLSGVGVTVGGGDWVSACTIRLGAARSLGR